MNNRSRPSIKAAPPSMSFVM